ncbi:MAG TPA: phosphotransferase [Streptosporangiaceae bacterium]|nr:phosphotransferase [Streptosporangiaceae bacterium]
MLPWEDASTGPSRSRRQRLRDLDTRWDRSRRHLAPGLASCLPGDRPRSRMAGRARGLTAGAAPFRAGYARLRELVTGLPQDRHVIHGDLVNRNVLINGATITAVIDWGNAMYGTTYTTPPGSFTGAPGSPPGRTSTSAANCASTGTGTAAPLPTLIIGF